MPPKVEFEQIDEHGSMVHSVISCSLGFHGKGCRDPSTIGDYTLSFNRLYFSSCTVHGDTPVRRLRPKGTYGDREHSGGIAAVDGQAGASDEAGVGAGEVGDQASDLVTLAV